MQQFDYIEEANRTMSNNFHEGVPAIMVAGVLKQVSTMIDPLDAVKKKLFYGRVNMSMDSAIEICRQAGADMAEIDFAKLVPGKSQDEAIRIFHGIIGVITEAGEMAFALAEAIGNGTALDLTNIGEEVGDNQWYVAATLRAMGRTFDDVHRQNINKLRLRFPDKFNEYDANNRDLNAERKLLEGTPFAEGAGGLASPRKPVVQIKDWTIIGRVLVGTALDHPRAPKGVETEIRSSRILRDDSKNANAEVETLNTIYKLL